MEISVIHVFYIYRIADFQIRWGFDENLKTVFSSSVLEENIEVVVPKL